MAKKGSDKKLQRRRSENGKFEDSIGWEKKGGEEGCRKRWDDVERRNDGEEKGESGGPGAEPPEKFLGPRPFLEGHALFQIQGNALFYFRATPLY